MNRLKQLELPSIVRPFAHVLDAATVGQHELDQLRDLYDAEGIRSFEIDTYELGNPIDLRVHSLTQLPFRLALGIHPSVSRSLDESTIMITAEEYRVSCPPVRSGQERLRRNRMAEKVESAICGAIIEAAMDGTRQKDLQTAHQVVTEYDLVSRQAGKLVQKTVKLLTRS